MRSLVTMALVLGVVALVASPALAQPPFGGFGGGGNPAQLMANKSVQEELKMTDDQVKKATKFQEDMRPKMQEAFQKLQGVKPEEFREKMAEAMKPLNEEAEKFAKDTLKPEQMKRLKQIQLQQEGVAALTKDEVKKELKLDDKQATQLKALADDFTKERGEIMRNAGRDPEKRAEAQKKVTELTKETMTKVNKVLKEDQQKTWKDMVGTPFEIKFERRPPQDR
jgi:membrane protein involved in colicin uptake